jgi:SAM-dependent methyltransferase
MTSIEQRLRAYYDEEMAQRAERPLGAEREGRLAGFVRRCHEAGLTSVVEIGCGAGRDGKVLAASGLAYRGLDLSTAAVELCRGLGLDAVVGQATELPYATDEFDAGWSMSTLMHLPGDGFVVALGELHRVIRPGGVLEVGLWGADENRQWTDPDGRYFRSRTDEDVRALLSAVGQVGAFDTWSRFEDGGHYQWARIVVE